MYDIVFFSREVAGNFSNSNVETQPPMMSFKAFLGTQEDTITDEEAIKRYNEYKLEFRRQQLNEFFVAHKDEEWYINFDILFFFFTFEGVACRGLNNFITAFLIDDEMKLISTVAEMFLLNLSNKIVNIIEIIVQKI